MKNENLVDEKESDWAEIDKLAEVVAKNLMGQKPDEVKDLDEDLGEHG
ncbi:MAG: hypothetical protein OXI87_04200 [Albidovulum sp.]|nr:hypothetical protein [Albidovulum sp.]